jgi:serine/threonine protein phosphatase PrpC
MELTQDHGAENPDEVVRMKAAHPGEEDTVLIRGRVLGGLMPTRSMGDARYKVRAFNCIFMQQLHATAWQAIVLRFLTSLFSSMLNL